MTFWSPLSEKFVPQLELNVYLYGRGAQVKREREREASFGRQRAGGEGTGQLLERDGEWRKGLSRLNNLTPRRLMVQGENNLCCLNVPCDPRNCIFNRMPEAEADIRDRF